MKERPLGVDMMKSSSGDGRHKLEHINWSLKDGHAVLMS